MKKNLIRSLVDSGTGALYLLTITFFLLLQGVNTYAQNINRPNIEGPYGVQANSYTGSLFFQRTDLFIPGRGLSLDITFSYNSSNRGIDQGFGYGWSFTYCSSYRFDSTGMTLVNSDGREDHYTGSNGIYTSPKGIFDRLHEYQPGKFKIISKNKTEYLYEDSTHKKLTRIRERNGNEVLLAYNNGKLVSVTDPSGRVVSLTWSNGKLAELKTESPLPSRRIQYSYNVAGCLVSVKDPLNNSISYTYGPGRILNGLTDKNGNPLSITYNSNSAVIKFVSCQSERSISYNSAQRKTYVTDKNDNGNSVTIYAFDENGRLKERSGNCCGFRVAFEYDDFENVSKRTDANGNITYFTYDVRGNILSETDPLNKTALYTYDTAFSQVTSIRDKNGSLTQFVYDAKGNLTESRYPLGILTKYGYDNFGNRTSYTDAKNHVTVYGYNANGYLTTIASPDGGNRNFTYDEIGNPLTNTDANNHTSAFAYDELDRLLTIQDALNGFTTYTYDPVGNIISIKDANNQTTTYVYDALGNLIAVTDPSGAVNSMSYDALGNLLISRNGNGHTTKYEYDHLKRKVAEINPEGERTSYSYDGNGNRVGVISPNGHTMQMLFDPINRLTEIRDNIGTLFSYTYDGSSNKLTQTDGAGNTTTFQYDALNRPVKQINASGDFSLFEYDASSNLVKVTDKNSNAHTYTYDEMNRQLSSKDPLNFTTTYQYDKEGNLLSVTDPLNNLTGYTYDVLNRNIVETFADNSLRVFTYDAVGNMTSRKDQAGMTVTYRIDKLNRVVAKVYANGVDTFAYDATGQLLYAKNAHAIINLEYDKAGRVLRETLNEKITAYAYNAAQGTKKVTYPSGRIVEFRVDKRGNLVSVKNNGKAIADFQYNNNGQYTSKQFGNGTLGTYTYNDNRNVSKISFSPSSFFDVDYEYDKIENIKSAQHRHHPSGTEQYTYDKVNQLTSFNKGSQQDYFVYDAVGNRTTAQLNGLLTNYTVNSMNAYSAIMQGSSTLITYDLNGNVTNDGSRTFAYDAENRLTSVNSGATASYYYDPFGRRIQKNLPTDTIRYYFDGLQVIEEYKSNNAPVVSYTWGAIIDDILAAHRQGNVYYYHSGPTGSVAALTDSSAKLVERYEYDVFGKVNIFAPDYSPRNNSAVGNTITFSGKELDTETNLYFSRARTYAPSHGRFLQRDPMGYIDGFNIYAYTGNDPVNYIDPLGTVRWKDAGLAVWGIASNIGTTATGVAIGAATSWTGVGLIAGGAIAVKGAYGVGANSANLWAALNHEDPVSSGSLFGDIANAIDPCNDALQAGALALDFAIDLARPNPKAASNLIAKKPSLLDPSRKYVVIGKNPDYKEFAAQFENATVLDLPHKWTHLSRQEAARHLYKQNSQRLREAVRNGYIPYDIGYGGNFYKLETLILESKGMVKQGNTWVKK